VAAWLGLLLVLEHRLFLAEWLVYRLASWHVFHRIRIINAEKEAARNGDLESQVLQEGAGMSPPKFNMSFECMKKQRIFGTLRSGHR
jgi:hypothetical protein